MKRSATLATAMLIATTSLAARNLATQTVRYSIGDTAFESVIVYHPDAKAPMPGILMFPNWMGPTESSLKKAKEIAGDGYLVMMVDMYGTDVRPADAKEAGQASSVVRGDRDLMRKRATQALDQLTAAGKPLKLDPDRIAAIGFCFGGGVALELGRTGADLDAIVTFHGDLMSPTLEADAGKTKAKVLVLHGADDPFVPLSDVNAFMDTMRKTDVDWQVTEFSHTVHSFTDPTADSDGARYNPVSAERAFKAMNRLFDEIW